MIINWQIAAVPLIGGIGAGTLYLVAPPVVSHLFAFAAGIAFATVIFMAGTK